jgi:hypothetical protein
VHVLRKKEACLVEIKHAARHERVRLLRICARSTPQQKELGLFLHSWLSSLLFKDRLLNGLQRIVIV